MYIVDAETDWSFACMYEWYEYVEAKGKADETWMML